MFPVSTLLESSYFSADPGRGQGEGDHEDDLHSAGRPESLLARLQVSDVAGEAHHIRQSSGQTSLLAKYFRHPDPAGLQVDPPPPGLRVLGQDQGSSCVGFTG